MSEVYFRFNNLKEVVNYGMKSLIIVKENGEKGCERVVYYIFGVIMEVLSFLYEVLDYYWFVLKILNDVRDIIKVEDIDKICFWNVC